jgi:competence protein ComGC
MNEEVRTAYEVAHVTNEAVSAISEFNASTARYSLRTRRLVRMIIISLIFDVLLTFAVFFVAQENHTQSSAQTHAQCEQMDAYRASQNKIWDHVISELTPTGSKDTPQTKAFLQNLEDFIHQVDTPIVCPAP